MKRNDMVDKVKDFLGAAFVVGMTVVLIAILTLSSGYNWE